MALSNTNKLYVWGASPKVLKLQAQALKKTRILEQQEANEKQANNSEKNIEKEGNDTAINKNTQETAKESNKQILSTKIITSGLQLRRKQFDGISTRNINVGLLEESQAHLKPSLVDTSLVKGRIIQVCKLLIYKYIVIMLC